MRSLIISMLRGVPWWPFKTGPNKGGPGILLTLDPTFDPHRMSMVTGQCWLDDAGFQPTEDDWKWTRDVGKILTVLLATHGVIVFRGIHAKAETEDLLRDWYRVYEKTPRHKGCGVSVSELFGDPDLTPDSPELIDILTDLIAPEAFDRISKRSFPGFAFGANQRIPIFHLARFWKIRIREIWLQLALYGCPPQMLTEIDRISTLTAKITPRSKLKRKVTLCHIDGNPGGISNPPPQKFRKIQDVLELEAPLLGKIQGMVMLADAHIDAPGLGFVAEDCMVEMKTHEEYRAFFASQRSITSISKKKDPMRLHTSIEDGGRMQSMGSNIRAGDILKWHERRLHGQVGAMGDVPGGRSRYCAYTSATPTPTNAQREDADMSFQTGVSPFREPSGGKTSAVQPKNFSCYPSQAEKFATRTGVPLTSRVAVAKNGDTHTVPELAPLDPQIWNYTIPLLCAHPVVEAVRQGKSLAGVFDNYPQH
jgi:hypothetical protein